MSIRATMHLPEWRSRASRAERAERAWRRSMLEAEADVVRRAAEQLPTARNRVC